jgi:hypothetical protein
MGLSYQSSAQPACPAGTQSDNAAEGLLPNLDLSNPPLGTPSRIAQDRGSNYSQARKEPWRQAKCPRQLKSHRKDRNGKSSDWVHIWQSPPPIFMPPVAAQQMIGKKMVERTLFVGM